MKTFALQSVVVTLLVTILAVAAFAYGCPFSVDCPIDGQMMTRENCQYNSQTHAEVCKFGHNHLENGEQVHHYVYVECD